MANYVFEEILSPLDFEYLTRDILSRVLNIELIAFSEGRDKGTDLRYYANKQKKIVVQCKRRKSISNEELEDELDKVKKLKPSVYYFVISSDLSVAKFNYIRELFKDWMKSDDNIFTKSRLNQLLDQYPDIHQRHHKLWLNSSLMFNSLINQPLYERAKALITSIKKDYRFYVRNESVNKAFEILNKHQFIIISGIPGIGKTSLARMLLWEYLLNGYEVVEIRKIVEGEQILIENTQNKQVYYFDDFLGENFLKYDVIEGRSNDLVQFIKRIMNNKNKVLIMTTREYILQQAKERYEKLDTQEFDVFKYTLDISNYSKKIKSLILYNHLYYSGIPLDYIKNIISTKSYRTIINHKNYSPRIIEQMTVFLKDIDPNSYSSLFIQNLNYPFGIWEKAIKSQISEGSRFMLFILLSIGGPILLSDFKKVILQFNNISNKRNINFKVFDSKIYLKELEDTFIKIDITNSRNHFLNFQNPSVKDFLLEIVRNDKELILLLLSSISFFNQLVYIINYLIDNYRQDSEIRGSIKNIIIENFESFLSSSYIFSNNLEVNRKTAIIEKITSLIPYLKINSDAELINFVIDKFYLIEIKSLSHYQEKQYIGFIKEFPDVIEFEYKELINNIFSNISWLENISNFLSLKELDDVYFDEFIKSKKDEVKERIEITFEKEIEYSDTPELLNDLASDISELKESIEEVSAIDFTYYDRAINNKINEINTIKEEEEDEKEEIEIDDYERDFSGENYNVDELFKEELFI